MAHDGGIDPSHARPSSAPGLVGLPSNNESPNHVLPHREWCLFLCLARSPEGSGSTWEVGLKSQSATCCAVTGGPANHPCWVGPTPRMNPIGGSFLESSWAQGLGGPGTCTPLRWFSVVYSAFHPARRLSRRQCQQYLHVPSI